MDLIFFDRSEASADDKDKYEIFTFNFETMQMIFLDRCFLFPKKYIHAFNGSKSRLNKTFVELAEKAYTKPVTQSILNFEVIW